jgi:hypothetical protein
VSGFQRPHVLGEVKDCRPEWRWNGGLVMKFALVILVPLILFGCSEETAPRAPTAPDPPVPTAPDPPVPPAPLPPSQPPRLTSLWVVVIEEGARGASCVPGATVEIVRGEGLGQSLKQTNSCSYWDPDYDLVFRGLTAGAELTLRASAPGYAAKEVTMVPPGPQRAVAIELAWIP